MEGRRHIWTQIHGTGRAPCWEIVVFLFKNQLCVPNDVCEDYVQEIKARLSSEAVSVTLWKLQVDPSQVGYNPSTYQIMCCWQNAWWEERRTFPHPTLPLFCLPGKYGHVDLEHSWNLLFLPFSFPSVMGPGASPPKAHDGVTEMPWKTF